MKRAINTPAGLLRLTRHSLLILLYLVITGCASTQPRLSHTHSLLWKISAPIDDSAPTRGQRESYLFGTIHSEDRRVTQLPAKLISSLSASQKIFVEIVPDNASVRAANQRMFFTDGKMLNDYLPTQKIDAITNLLEKQGVDRAHVNMLKPWAIFTLLSTPPPETGVFLDIKLMQLAQQKGLKLDALESMSEQIDVFDHLPMETQLSLLDSTLTLSSRNQFWLEETVNAWLSYDLNEIERVSQSYFAELKPEDAKILESRLVIQRNHNMAEKLSEPLRQGGIFIAVGALHLPGKQGLLALLHKQGYHIEPVPLK